MSEGVRIEVVSNRFPEILSKLKAAAEQVVAKTALDVEATAKELVPKDTHATQNSIQAEPGADALHWIVAPHTNYALYLELGTRYMPARPYMTPAIEANRANYERAWQSLESLLG